MNHHPAWCQCEGHLGKFLKRDQRVISRHGDWVEPGTIGQLGGESLESVATMAIGFAGEKTINLIESNNVHKKCPNTVRKMIPKWDRSIDTRSGLIQIVDAPDMGAEFVVQRKSMDA
jgi:hypothetical protein